jgi:hypothetical protein
MIPVMSAKLHRRRSNDPMGRLLKAGKMRRPWVVGIYEFEFEPNQPDPSFSELMVAAGLNGYTDVNMGLKQEEGYAVTKGNIGGFTACVKDKENKLKSVIFLRHDKRRPSKDMDTINRMVLAHELQHADDIESGKTKLGSIDAIQSEYDAHVAALKWAFDYHDSECLGFYLASLHAEFFLRPALAGAARRVIESADYEKYRTLAGSFFYKWENQMKPDIATNIEPPVT